MKRGNQSHDQPRTGVESPARWRFLLVHRRFRYVWHQIGNAWSSLTLPSHDLALTRNRGNSKQRKASGCIKFFPFQVYFKSEACPPEIGSRCTHLREGALSSLRSNRQYAYVFSDRTATSTCKLRGSTGTCRSSKVDFGELRRAEFSKQGRGAPLPIRHARTTNEVCQQTATEIGSYGNAGGAGSGPCPSQAVCSSRRAKSTGW